MDEITNEERYFIAKAIAEYRHLQNNPEFTKNLLSIMRKLEITDIVEELLSVRVELEQEKAQKRTK